MGQTRLNARQLLTAGKEDIATDEEVAVAIDDHCVEQNPHPQYKLSADASEELRSIRTELNEIKSSRCDCDTTNQEQRRDRRHDDAANSSNSDVNNMPKWVSSHAATRRSTDFINRRSATLVSRRTSDAAVIDVYEDILTGAGLPIPSKEEVHERATRHSKYATSYLTVQAFKGRFTVDERTTIELLQIDNPNSPMEERKRSAFCRFARSYLDKLEYVDLQCVELKSIVERYETYSIISSGRAVEITSAPIKSKERYRKSRNKYYLIIANLFRALSE